MPLRLLFYADMPSPRHPPRSSRRRMRRASLPRVCPHGISCRRTSPCAGEGHDGARDLSVRESIGSADKMRSPRFAQMRCIYSGQRQPIMRRTSRLHSWDVFASEPLPNRLRPSDLALGRLSKETNHRRSGATSRICRRREDSADV